MCADLSPSSQTDIGLAVMLIWMPWRSEDVSRKVNGSRVWLHAGRRRWLKPYLRHAYDNLLDLHSAFHVLSSLLFDLGDDTFYKIVRDVL